jgi:DNA-binding response OmpR family regulator
MPGGFVSRILIYEPRDSGQECAQSLAGEGHDVVACPGPQALFDALGLGRPDVVVYVMGDLTTDMDVLSVVRRMAATLPIILLGGPACLEARRSVQQLKPTYYGVFPLEPGELRDVVRGALSHQSGRTRGSYSMDRAHDVPE